jgi:hypothetical protein
MSVDCMQTNEVKVTRRVKKEIYEVPTVSQREFYLEALLHRRYKSCVRHEEPFLGL